MIANCGSDERHKYHGGASGDQTGTEYRVIKWYNRPWNYVLRPKSRTVGNKLAQISRQAAENNKIGYDQYQRLTYFDALSKADWNPSKITTKCETDCTASTAANVIATGHQLGIKPLQEVSPSLYSGNIRKGLMATGEFETLTASKYLTSDKYLLPGDILLYENHHAAVNLDTGSSTTSSTSTSTNKPASTSSSSTSKPSKSNKIDVDGEWGKATTRAAQRVFSTTIDGIVSRQIAKYKKYMPHCLTSSWEFKTSGYHGGSQLIKAIQKWCGAEQDGLVGPSTIKKFQHKLGVKADGYIGGQTVTAFQRYLNKYL